MAMVIRSEGGLGLLLSLASARTFKLAARALAEYEMTPRGYAALQCLTDGPRSQRDLAELLTLDPSRIVALVDSLVSAGLAERLPDPGDRRVRLVTMTDSGRATSAGAQRAVDASLAAALEPLDANEQATLEQLLTRIVDAP